MPASSSVSIVRALNSRRGLGSRVLGLRFSLGCLGFLVKGVKRERECVCVCVCARVCVYTYIYIYIYISVCVCACVCVCVACCGIFGAQCTWLALHFREHLVHRNPMKPKLGYCPHTVAVEQQDDF